ncbi:lactococcin 972 family bacteriocin [Brevibacillus laterosporus]|uniref:lactococcin 972 family bacteriocin n=2 Tax=Brevibacillus laterosporus TaxID=1465 RepID=UPI001F55565B|nr:lactococcin 972 family bacteriocin [Brevibacillus laterosporus]MED1910477.1 lactococcin 972 family bacteriocin [Brevibacillus laterosporus]
MMLKKSMVGLIAVLTLAMGSQAMATDGKAELVNSNVTPFKTIGAGGGDWNYGSSKFGAQKKCWSHYKHPDNFHSATAIIGDDEKTDYAEAGEWAKADAYGDKDYTCYTHWDDEPKRPK